MMNKLNLFWIIPLSFIIGMLFYAVMENEETNLQFNAMMECYCELYPQINNSYCVGSRLFINQLKSLGAKNE